jgi:hypothetical protein
MNIALLLERAPTQSSTARFPPRRAVVRSRAFAEPQPGLRPTITYARAGVSAVGQRRPNWVIQRPIGTW